MSNNQYSHNNNRTVGREAQRLNIAAAKLIAETVRTTLGPKGMDKMLVNAEGDITITNDGVTILEQMSLDHPSAHMLVEIAKTQEAEVGDGTTTTVVLAGEMLKQAEALLDKEIHPTIIARGFYLAAQKSQEVLESLAQKVTMKDTDILKSIAHTAMTGKGSQDAKEHLAELIVQATTSIAHNNKVERNNIAIETKTGARVQDTQLIQGIIIDKERAHSAMPTTIKNAKIALIDSALEVKNTEIDARISIQDPDKLQGFLDLEERMLKEMVHKITHTGANVVFCQRGIDDLAQHYLAKAGILAIRRVKKSDMERLSRATKATITTNLQELSSADLGSAGLVEEKSHAKQGMIYVQECEHAQTVTILVRGGSEHLIEEIKRALEDAIGDVATVINEELAVAGAGTTEIALAKALEEYAATLKGREQLAVKAFAQALEIIPETLAENAGIDPIDALTNLRSQENKGINVHTGETIDAWARGVIEPLKVKTQALSSAADVAIMILRIDDVILAGEEEQRKH